MSAPKRMGKTPRPAEPGEELATQGPKGILPRELPIVKALGIPVGVFNIETEPGDIMASIMEEIVAAGSVAKALEAATVEGLSTYAGKELTFLDFKYQPSDFDPEGWPYVVCRVADGNGTPHVVTSGAKQVVVMMALARKTGELPFKARVERVDFDTAEGERRHADKLVAP